MRIVITEEQYSRLFVKEPISLRDEFDYLINEQGSADMRDLNMRYPNIPQSTQQAYRDYQLKKVENFYKWLGTWDAQDWIDAAATVAFAVSPLFPPAALIAIGLEGVNLSISTYNLATGEGSWGDVGLRAVFLFGGPFIGRVIGKAFSLAGSAVAKVFGGVVEVFNRIAGKNYSKKQIAMVMDDVFEGSVKYTAKEKKLAKDMLDDVVKDPDLFKSEIKNIDELVEGVKNGDKEALEQLKNAKNVGKRRRLIDELNPFSSKRDYDLKLPGGKTVKVNKYWYEMFDFPRGRLGMTLFLGIFTTVYGVSFYTWLKAEGFKEELIQGTVNDLAKEESGMQDLIDGIKRKYPEIKNLDDGEVLLYGAEKKYFTESEWEQIQINMEDTLKRFEKKISETEKIISKIKNDKNTLAFYYNNQCYDDIQANLPTVNVSADSTRKKGTRNYNIKKFGILFKDHYFVFKGTDKGIWKKEKDDVNKKSSGGSFDDINPAEVLIGGIDMVKMKQMTDSASENYVDVTSNCKISVPLVNSFCKSGKEEQRKKDFCASIELINLTQEEQIQIYIDVINDDVKSEHEKSIDSLWM